MSLTDRPIGRRGLLAGALGGVAVAATAPSPAAPRRSPYPPDVNVKFHPDGRVRRFAGSTTVCHLPQQGPQSACFDALLDVYREAPTQDFMRKVTLLPPSSYHMTIIGGALDRPRSRPLWPADLPLDMPIGECSAILARRLSAAGISCDLPIRMVVDDRQDPTNGMSLMLRLKPADETERRKLAALRRAIGAATGMPPPSPDGYRFHISIGYFFRWLDRAEEARFVATFHRWARDVAARAPVIELGPPEFCTHQDMFAFHRILTLG